MPKRRWLQLAGWIAFRALGDFGWWQARSAAFSVSEASVIRKTRVLCVCACLLLVGIRQSRGSHVYDAAPPRFQQQFRHYLRQFFDASLVNEILTARIWRMHG